ncbi:MAG: hypothetical protein RSC58_09185, partial [Ruthenibacterium sp.]
YKLHEDKAYFAAIIVSIVAYSSALFSKNKKQYPTKKNPRWVLLFCSVRVYVQRAAAEPCFIFGA